MLQTNPRIPGISPAVAALVWQNVRGAAKKPKINLRAIPEAEQWIRIKRPKLPSKNKGGAPKGNRNGLKHGRYTAAHKKEMRQMRLAVRQTIALLKMEAAFVRAEAARMDADTVMRLREAGLSSRVLWPGEW